MPSETQFIEEKRIRTESRKKDCKSEYVHRIKV